MAKDNNFTDLPAFFARDLEPMRKECSMVQVLALVERMGVRVVIDYVDGRTRNGEVAYHMFGDGRGDRVGMCPTMWFNPLSFLSIFAIER